MKTKDNEAPELLSEEELAEQNTAPELSEEEKATLKKKKTKKSIIIAIAILCIIGVVSGLLLYFEPWVSKEKQEPIGMYGSMKQYNNYVADYDLDVTSVDEYMDLDRNIYYSRNGEEIILEYSEENSADQNFFIDYFDAAINGRYEEYNTMFTDKYYETTEPYTRFTPQMIYAIHVEKLSEKYEGGKNTYKYNVTYKIYRNNGTFRNDIGSDGSKTLYFELVEENGKVKIDRITYYV